MKTVQKTEIVAGLLTLVSTATYIFVNVLPVLRLKLEDDKNVTGFLLKSFLLFGLPPLLVAIGTFVHACYRSRIGLTLLITGATVLLAFFGLMLISLATFYYHGIVGGLIASLPGMFALISLYCAHRFERSPYLPLS